jgi:hypothetical protein
LGCTQGVPISSPIFRPRINTDCCCRLMPGVSSCSSRDRTPRHRMMAALGPSNLGIPSKNLNS